MRRHALPLAVGLSLMLACYGDDPRSFGPTGPSADVSDGQSGGNPDFFFLPPLMPDPSGLDDFGDRAFNPLLSPQVEICLLDGDACAVPQPDGFPLIFTMTTGPGSETVRLVLEDEHYIVNWHTNNFDIVTDGTYRISVFPVPGSSTLLGFLDLSPVSASEMRNKETGETFTLKDGSTAVIAFRIEQGAVSDCDGNCVEQVIEPGEEALVQLLDEDGIVIGAWQFPDNWSPDDQARVATIEENPTFFPPFFGPLNTNLNQWPKFLIFELDPPLPNQDFNADADVFVAVCQVGDFPVDDPQSDYHVFERGRMQLAQQLSNENVIRLLEPGPEGLDAELLANEGGEPPCFGVEAVLDPGGESFWIVPDKVLPFAQKLFGPRPLYASASALAVSDGGLTGSLEKCCSDINAVETSEIQGTVTVEGEGEPEAVAGATIRLTFPDGETFVETTTNADGFYSFPGLDEGTYTVELTDAGDLDVSFQAESEDCDPGEGAFATCVIDATEILVVDFTEAAAQIFSLLFVQEPSNTVRGTAINPAVVVRAFDETESVLAGVSIELTNDADNPAGCGILAPANAITDETGEATFTNLTVSGPCMDAGLEANGTLLGFQPASASSQPYDIAVAGFGTATIDGAMGTTEWENADCVQFDANVPEGGTTPATLCVMNDNVNFYFGLNFERSPDPQSLGAIEFDLDGDRVLGIDPTDDLIVIQQPPEGGFFRDEHIFTTESGSAGTRDDTQEEGGSEDGEGAYTNNEILGTFEFSHPLSSGDVFDISVDQGEFTLIQAILTITDPEAEQTAVTRLPAGSQGIPMLITVFIE